MSFAAPSSTLFSALFPDIIFETFSTNSIQLVSVCWVSVISSVAMLSVLFSDCKSKSLSQVLRFPLVSDLLSASSSGISRRQKPFSDVTFPVTRSTFSPSANWFFSASFCLNCAGVETFLSLAVSGVSPASVSSTSARKCSGSDSRLISTDACSSVVRPCFSTRCTVFSGPWSFAFAC